MAQLRTLMEELEQNGLLFDQFVDAEVARLNSIRAGAENMNAEAKVDVAARKQSKAELEARLAETKKELSSKKTEVDAVLAEVANLRKTAQEDVPAKLSDRNKQLEAEQRALEAARRQVAEKREGRELRRNEMAKGIPFYKDRLGLAFERMPDGSLSFRMTLVDPQNPARPFTFALLVTPQNAYQVLRCEPRVDFDALLGQLNRDNDLSVFVRQMRRLFKNLV